MLNVYSAKVFELYNAGALRLRYHMDTTPLEELMEENFSHPVLQCLNPTGELEPGHTAMLEWIFSPLEAKTYTVSYSTISFSWNITDASMRTKKSYFIFYYLKRTLWATLICFKLHIKLFWMSCFIISHLRLLWLIISICHISNSTTK